MGGEPCLGISLVTELTWRRWWQSGAIQQLGASPAPLVRKMFPDRRQFKRQQRLWGSFWVQKNIRLCKRSHSRPTHTNWADFTFSFPVALHSFRQLLQGVTAKLISRGVFNFHGVFNSLAGWGKRSRLFTSPLPPLLLLPEFGANLSPFRCINAALPSITSVPHGKVQLWCKWRPRSKKLQIMTAYVTSRQATTKPQSQASAKPLTSNTEHATSSKPQASAEGRMVEY